jgi:hypothetical protein
MRERGSPGSINTGGASSARSVVMGSGLAPSARPGTTTEVISRMSYKDYWWRALRGAPSGPSCRDGDPRCSDILAPGRRALIFVKVVAASMSGSGQTRTFQPRWLMSAIPPIAEVLTRSRHVSKAPEADIRQAAFLWRRKACGVAGDGTQGLVTADPFHLLQSTTREPGRIEGCPS